VPQARRAPFPIHATKEDFPVKTVRIFAGVCVALATCFLVLCTIKDDNGSLAPTGPSSNSGGGTVNPFLMVVPDSQYIGVKDTLGISVTVLTDSLHNIPIANARVTCVQSHGWLSAETLYTNAKGRVVFQLVDTVKMQVNLVITCGQTQQTLSIQVTDAPDKIQKQFLIVPARAILKADGTDNTTIEATLKDQNNNPISGQCVQFISSAGMIMGTKGTCSGTGQSATSEQGVAQAVLTSAAVNDTAYITAYLVSDKTKNAQTKVVFSGVSVLLHADSTNLKPLGQTTITALLTDGSNNPIPYTPVYFILGKDTASNLSIVSKDTVTGPAGSAQCVVRGKRTGTDSVRVSAAGALSTIRINVTDLSLSVFLDDKILQADASKSTLLHAVFSSSSGSPLAHKTVQVKRSYKQIGGADTSDYLFATTDTAGKCAVSISALPYECVMTLEVTAFNSASDLASTTTSLSFISTRTLVATAVPPVVQADGTSQSVITVQVKNASNNPMTGDSILFTTDAGMVTAAGITDNSGRAVAYLTSDRRNTVANVKATVAKDPTKFLTIQVQFSGVQLTASANPPSINANGKDSTTISISLVDGAKNPIVGEPINFSKLQDSTFIFKADSVTDNRGTAICKVYGKGSGTDTIKIQAAGASAAVPIYYSANFLSIDTVGYQACIANGKDSTEIRVAYLQGDKVTPVQNAQINISITLGTINHDTVFARQFTLAPANSGVLHFYMKNPGFANTSTIFAYAKTTAEVTASTFQLYFRSTTVRKITLTATPSVIAANGNKSVLTAIAFDSLGNRVKDEQLTFNMFDGPGGGEYVDPAMVITGSDGSASANFVSGTTPSAFHGVGLVASDISGIKSDSVYVTIAGPPVRISVAANIEKGLDYSDGTFGLPVAAIVTDVNGNPVADGTQVTFSLQPSGYVYYVIVPVYTEQTGIGGWAVNITRDSVARILTFEDFNNNFKLDPGEDRNGDGFANRGEDLNGDGIYNPGPAYEDINHNGIRDIIFGSAEPPHVCSNGDTVLPDLNQNGFWDPIEPLLDADYLTAYDSLRSHGAFMKIYRKQPLSTADSGYWSHLCIRDSAYMSGPGFIPALHSYDFSWTAQPYPQPSPAVSITRTVQTSGGKAINTIVYGQTNANKVEVMVWAECQGVVCEFPLQQVLPVISTSVTTTK
jgi:adhesin/invasin